MEKNSNVELSYWAELPLKYSHFLVNIRHWGNVKISEINEQIWLKDFNEQQFKSIELNSIPYIQLYFNKNGLLFQKNKLVPFKKIKSGIYWSSLSSYFPLEMKLNQNSECKKDDLINLRLVKSDVENKSILMKCSLNQLEKFMFQNPDFRYNNIDWCIVGDEALLKGNPFLPIQGNSYWFFNSFILPSGYHLNYPMFANCIINEKSQDFYYLWLNEIECIKIEKSSFVPLSISSFRKTKHLI